MSSENGPTESYPVRARGDVRTNEAAKLVAATAEKTAIANALKQEREAASHRSDPNSPLSPGRLAYESVWNQHKQPWGWDNLHPLGDVPKRYKNPIPWLGIVKPANWNKQEQAVDEDGKPLFDSRGERVLTWANPLRIRHPNAPFMSSRRLQMYRDTVFAAAEPMYLTLWAINIDGERWLGAEGLIAEDEYWWNRYQSEFGVSTAADAEASSITSHDGTSQPSGAGSTPEEA